VDGSLHAEPSNDGKVKLFLRRLTSGACALLALCLTIPGRAGIALFAAEAAAKNFVAACDRNDPGPIYPRRIMANVLIVATFKLSHPMLFFVLMEANDSSVHARPGV
jgi:hypothetical protein